MIVYKIVKEYCVANGYNGLYNEDHECHCKINSVLPKNCLCGECKPVYLKKNTLELEPGQIINIKI